MTFRSSLAAGVAAVALFSAGFASQAQAASKTDETIAAQAAEIDLLRQELQALKARLDAQDARQARVEQQAAQAAASAQMASSEIETIPTRVQTAVAEATPKPKESWADKTKISGRMYYNISNVQHESDGMKLPPTGASFEIKRFYVGIDHKFNDTYSANITTDVGYVSNDGLTEVFVKKAYLQAKYSDALTLRIGSADLPWVPFAEGAYGYRWIENEMVDRVKFGTSADWGVHAFGKLGMIDYAAAVVNGAGYKNPTRTKSPDFEGRISTTMQGFTVGAGVHTGKLGKDVQNATTYHTATRWNVLAAYKGDNFRLGAEYFTADNWTRVTSVTEDSADGWSIFGSYDFTPKISAFARYDNVDPSNDLNPQLEDNYFNLGVAWSAAKIVDFALVYKRDKVENGTLSTSNGVIGGSDEGTYDEIGLFGQLRW